MNAQASRIESTQVTHNEVKRRRIDAVGWGLLLLITGGVLLLPDQRMAEIAWLIGVGLVLLGANLVRYLNGMRMGIGNFVLGSAALAGGVAMIFGISLPLLPIVLILFGACLVVSPLLEKDR
jgi:hypothetical protein